MNRRIITIIFSIFLLTVAKATFGVSLSLQPQSQTISGGQQVILDLMISDLGNNSAPSLGAFYVEISYDGNVIDLDSVDYGPFLGNPFISTETSIVTTDLSNEVHLDEFSFLTSGQLDALQPSTFRLATLVFNGIGEGTSALSLRNIDLSDALGQTISLANSQGAEITVVPVPTAFWLLSFGLIGLYRVARLKTA